LLIEEGRTNLILQSENFASGTWFKTGGSISSVANVEPDGSANSELFSEDGANSTHRTFQSFTGVSGTSYTLSVFLKFAGRQYVFLENRSINTNPYVVFDIQNGTVFITNGSLTSTIQAYPNGWYRCSVTGTADLAGGNYLIGGYSGGSQTYTGLNGPAFYLYGAQVEAGSFPTSYIPTTTGTLARSADVCNITNTAPFWNSSEFTVFTDANLVTSGIDTYASNFNITSGFFGVRRNSSNSAAAIIRSSGVTADINLGAFATGSMRMAAAHSTGQQAASLNGASAIQNNTAFVPSLNPLLNIGASSTGVYLNGHVRAIRYYKKRLPNAKLVALTT
jgi:hypothetical protein